MIQEIKIGNVVDDGSGDTLRDAGKKIQNNFRDIYDNLGDGTNVHPAGAWAQYTKNILEPEFGKTFAINATTSKVVVNLPKGSPKNYAMVIGLRDVWGSWAKHGVELVPASGDTIKGSSKSVLIKKNNADLELVYCHPGKWEYLDNKQINKLTSSDINSVATKHFVVSEDGQTDFLNVFGNDQYNKSNTTVHWRGNLLSYGDEFSKELSDYGSPGKTVSELVELDGKNIRLRHPTKKGDSIIVTTYLDGIASWRATYTRSSVRIIDPSISPETGTPGKSTVLKDKNRIKITEFDVDNINPNSLELTLNGILLSRVGDLGVSSLNGPDDGPIRDKGFDLNDQYMGYCIGASSGEKSECISLGGQWYEGIGDYRFEYNDDGIPIEVILNTDLAHNDVVSIKWFNNNIGTTMELDEILIKTDTRYLNKGSSVLLTNLIEYTDYKNNPTQEDVREAPDTSLDSISTIEQIFNLMYPIGTLYENAHNKANPKDYMGFGTWVRYAEGLTTVGWDSNVSNELFNKNRQDLDQNGNTKSTAGGVVGSQSTRIETLNIPPFKIDGTVLTKDSNGEVVIGGCLDDPSAEGPGYRKYTERELTVGNQSEGHVPTALNIVQPSITTYKWLRVA